MTISKSLLKNSARKLGLHAVGDFLIAGRSSDIISGLAIDKTPSFTYLWTFIVPTYDDLFMHMSLGERVAECGNDVDCLVSAHSRYIESIGSIRSAKDLVDYIDRKILLGEYSNWARYISLIRAGEFQAADGVCNLLFSLPMSNSIREKASKMRGVQIREGWASVQRLLGEWSDRTSALLPNVPSEI